MACQDNTDVVSILTHGSSAGLSILPLDVFLEFPRTKLCCSESIGATLEKKHSFLWVCCAPVPLTQGLQALGARPAAGVYNVNWIEQVEKLRAENALGLQLLA